ncbi:hypothetical protein DRW07_16150 [Alteromonas sediminis]|uniref:Uncharacterized protein n=1 Tax=Alteromonas sediminis TaxID=2259342 RepID=A0A3N5XY47_9ALTE|nr:hypothetical protein [Alteromonas sediminis]RPJ65433.1 hypothetical protein DRW07_16150 [Alteromonas sediminis]
MNLFNEPPVILINLAFLFQLFFISIFISRTWRKRRQVLLTKYPQNVFPNLYAQDEHTEQQRLTVRKWLDYSAFAIGLITFIALQVMGKAQHVIADWMLMIALIQLAPLFNSAYWCNQNSQILSKRYPKKIRTAQLQGNQLADYISIRRVMVSIVMYALSVGLAAYLYLVAMPGERKVIYLITLSTVVLICIGGLIRQLVYGQKKDHFIEQQERALKISDKLKYLISSLTAYSVFVIILLLSDMVELNDSYINLFASLFAQAIVFKTRNQYYPINPSVYKEEA